MSSPITPEPVIVEYVDDIEDEIMSARKKLMMGELDLARDMLKSLLD